MVFAGLGSAAFDFYGGDRRGQNLFANCTIALDARTGKRIWHFQTLHHDLWDHDLPTYPNLVTVTHNGQRIDAAVQVTKTGHVFLFNRETGVPLFPVEERPVPASDIPGEHAWPTQPIPVKPPWGVLNAIDLNCGEMVWQVPLGEHAALRHRGVPQTGTENFGGSIVTAGGLVLIGATKDEQFHAFDKATGKLLWQHVLPAGGYATPSTYSVNGRQFVVIVAGGAGKLHTRSGDAFVAFALGQEAGTHQRGTRPQEPRPPL